MLADAKTAVEEAAAEAAAAGGSDAADEAAAATSARPSRRPRPGNRAYNARSDSGVASSSRNSAYVDVDDEDDDDVKRLRSCDGCGCC